MIKEKINKMQLLAKNSLMHYYDLVGVVSWEDVSRESNARNKLNKKIFF